MSVTSNLTISGSLFELTTDMELFYYGILVFVFSIFNAPILALIITTLEMKNAQSPNMAFRLMNIINVCLLGQGLGHLLTFPCLIFPNLLKTFETVVRIIGGIMNTLWICDLSMVTLLGVSRVLIFSNTISIRKSDRIIRFLLILNMMMYPPQWAYDFDVPFCDLFDTLEISLSFPCILISFLSYLTIAYLIFVSKNLKSSVASRRNEIAILFQSALVTAYISVMIFVWHPALFTMFQFIDMNDQTNQAILNFMWIVHCYVNPCMLLVFNKSIRGDCVRLLRTGKIDQPPRAAATSIVTLS
ncbi:hypothetical protein B9Z55_018629 [Caenorhabditis nigoni]|uniref:G-protein coupled receptors family 1 profile domain-containing protein n=1 Tax=Caenorhabditis nigoni TaxID=1611254 RepID=A0A2G5TEU6_9PELO|nr:hypothetical protein B9Z55_018629 [Caenorhabditis nigoni]